MLPLIKDFQLIYDDTSLRSGTQEVTTNQTLKLMLDCLKTQIMEPQLLFCANQNPIDVTKLHASLPTTTSLLQMALIIWAHPCLLHPPSSTKQQLIKGKQLLLSIN